MTHKLNQSGSIIEATIEHNRITLRHNGENITQFNPEPPPPFMGCYSEQSEAWVLPSPIDAIKLLKVLPELLTKGYRIVMGPATDTPSSGPSPA